MKKTNINPFGSSSFGVGSSPSSFRPDPRLSSRPEVCSLHPWHGSESERSLILKHNSQLIKPADLLDPQKNTGGAAASPFDGVIYGESETPEVTPEAFLERFWEGVSLADLSPNSTPAETREAWECQKMLQRLQDAENNAAFARHFWEDWNQELENIASALNEFAGPLDQRLEEAAALDLEEILNELSARQQQTSLSELQAACITEAEAELSGEILEAERLEDFDQLMPAYIYIRLPERAKPFKPIMYNYYSPNRRAVKACGYTIGPESSGGDSGSGGDWDGGGSGDWGDGDGTGDGDSLGWGSGDFFFVILLGSGVIVIGRVIVDYGYKILASGIEKYLRVTKRKLDQLKNKIEPQTQTQKGKRAAALKVVPLMPSLVPVLLFGSALAVLSYVLHPEHLREIIELLADAIVILAHELGRVLLQLIPPQLHDLAERVGHAIELIGAYARQILEQVVIPVLLYARTFGIWFLSAFLVFKLVSLGAEIYQMLAASGVANLKVPPEVTAKALEVADCIGAITAEDSPALFLSQFFKGISLLVLGLVPAPDFSPELSPKLAKLFQLSVIVGVYGLVLQDTRHISQLAQAALQASPELNSMVSCIAGRWCLIIITVNLARRESALKNYSLPFYCLLYVLRVYQLAFTASPNLLPIP